MRHSETRTKLLDAAEKIMFEEGYAGVTSRTVAKSVGVNPALLHYYFPTLDDLFAALYRRTSEDFLTGLLDLFRAEDCLNDVWKLSRNVVRASLASEFLALANHRKSMQAEIRHVVRYTRLWQAEAMANAVERAGVDPADCPPAGVAVLISAVARTLAMEENLGIDHGHAEVTVIIERLLEKLQPRPELAQSAEAQRDAQ